MAVITDKAQIDLMSITTIYGMMRIEARTKMRHSSGTSALARARARGFTTAKRYPQAMADVRKVIREHPAYRESMGYQD